MSRHTLTLKRPIHAHGHNTTAVKLRKTWLPADEHRLHREIEAREQGGWQCQRGRCRTWNRKHLKMCRGCGKRGKPSPTMIKQAREAENARLAAPWQIISKA